MKRLATVKSHCNNRQYVRFTTLFILLSLSQLSPRIHYISSLSIIHCSLVRSLINHLSQITINHFNLLKYATKHYTTPPPPPSKTDRRRSVPLPKHNVDIGQRDFFVESIAVRQLGLCLSWCFHRWIVLFRYCCVDYLWFTITWW